MRRRDLLQLIALAPFAGRVAPLRAESPWRRTLVLVELKGGNDGLNTLVPFTDPLYYELRPRLALNPKSVLPLNKRWGLNSAMEALQPLWYDYEMAAVHGVGYPRPDAERSHFRSIAIWDTASDSNEYRQEGWLARQFADAPPRNGYAADAIEVGDGDSGPLAGGNMRAMVINDSVGFVQPPRRKQRAKNGALKHILQVREELRAAVNEQALPPFVEMPEGFPRSAFGRRLGQIARLMEGENAAPVYKVTLGGFDTHQNQRRRHDRLLRELAEGLAAFRKFLSAGGLWERTLVLTYSEFGRNAAENGSGGTDHGEAAPQFLFGGKVQGGLYGAPPSLTDLDRGALQFTTDFRRLYATVVEGWWGLEQGFAPGKHFEPIFCLRA